MTAEGDKRPTSTWNPSPNFKRGGPGRKIACIVLHATATPGLASPLSWLCNPQSQVSAHYLIDLDGTIYQLVLEEDVAWHAGKSEFRGRTGVNSMSVGIELVNANDGRQAYPPAQITAALALCASMCGQYRLTAREVVAHADVAPGRKNDPLAFPWDDFRTRLTAMLGGAAA